MLFSAAIFSPERMSVLELTSMLFAVLPWSSWMPSLMDVHTTSAVLRHVAAICAATCSMSSQPKFSIRHRNNFIAGVPPEELKIIFFFFIFF